MQIVIDVMDDGMATVTVDGGEPMGPMPAMEALEEVKGMMPAEDGEAMWNEEAAARSPAPEDEMMGDM